MAKTLQYSFLYNYYYSRYMVTIDTRQLRTMAKTLQYSYLYTVYSYCQSC